MSVLRKSRMNLRENRKRHAFTLIEMLVVIGVIAILASITLGVITMAKSTSQEKRIQGQLNQLITAIEQYKSKVGFYPPDHQLKNALGNVMYTRYGKPQVNPVLNSLYYELKGALVDISSESFIAIGDPVEYALGQNQVEAWFGVNGISNSGKSEDAIKSTFDGISESDVVLVSSSDIKSNTRPSGSVRLLSVPVSWPRQIQNKNPLGNTSINVWRYNSSNPTNNPASFDLWAEIPVKNKTTGDYELKIIGNWASE